MCLRPTSSGLSVHAMPTHGAHYLGHDEAQGGGAENELALPAHRRALSRNSDLASRDDAPRSPEAPEPLTFSGSSPFRAAMAVRAVERNIKVMSGRLPCDYARPHQPDEVSQIYHPGGCVAGRTGNELLNTPSRPSSTLSRLEFHPPRVRKADISRRRRVGPPACLGRAGSGITVPGK